MALLGVVGSIAWAEHAGPPSNDERASATRVTSPGVVAQYTTGAGTSTGEPTQCASAGSTVWFRLDTQVEGISLSTAGSSFDTVVSVYRNPQMTVNGPLDPVGCNDDSGDSVSSSLTFSSSGFGSYLIQVGGKNGATGFLKLAITRTTPGDAMVEPQLITTVPAVAGTSNVGMTTEVGETTSFTAPECGPTSVEVGATAWFRLNVIRDLGWIIVETSGSTVDTVLVAYRLDPYQGLVDRTCSDDSAGTHASQLARYIYPGNSYLFQVGGVRGAVGTIKLSVFGLPGGPSAPTATLNPKVLRNPDGTTLVLNDKNNDGAADPDEERLVVPIGQVPNPAVSSGPGGTLILFNDRDGDGDPDPGEESVALPGPPGTSPALHPRAVHDPRTGSVSVYIDKDEDGVMDPGEELVSTPGTGPVDPRVSNNPDGSRSVYNDSDFDGQPDQGEVLVVVPPIPPRPVNDDRSAAKEISAPFAEVVPMQNASVEPGEYSPCSGWAVKSVWYRIRPIQVQNLVIDTSASTTAPNLSVYRADTLGNLSLVECGQSSLTNTSWGMQVKPSDDLFIQVYFGTELLPPILSFKLFQV